MNFPMRIVIHKQQHFTLVSESKDSRSPAAGGDRFEVKFLASWICPYRLSFTLLRLDVFVCSPLYSGTVSSSAHWNLLVEMLR